MDSVADWKMLMKVLEMMKYAILQPKHPLFPVEIDYHHIYLQFQLYIHVLFQQYNFY